MTNPNTNPNLAVVDGGLSIRTEGRNEPAFYPNYLVVSVLDSEGDVWVKDTESDSYYLSGEPWNETPEEADTTLAEIEEEYGIEDFNVPVGECETDEDEQPEPVNTTPLNDDPAYKRGDVLVNIVSGREALVLGSQFSTALGLHVYTVIEKGYTYPAGCSEKRGAGTFPEQFLRPSGQPPFSEVETFLLEAVYTA